MVRVFITNSGKINNKPDFKYSISDVNLYMAIMKNIKYTQTFPFVYLILFNMYELMLLF